jgi:hypothetical protein
VAIIRVMAYAAGEVDTDMPAAEKEQRTALRQSLARKRRQQ